MTNEKKKTKANKFLDLKYVLIVSGIVLVIFGLFKYFTASDSVDNNKKEEEIKEKITSEVLYTKTEEGLNKVITSKFGDKELSIVCSKIDDSSCELKVNNKFVLNNNVDVVVESIHRVGDSLIILASESSSNSGYLYFINSDGSVNNVIGNRLENSLSFSLNVSSNKFKVEGSKIYFEMSSIREKCKLLVNGNLLVDVLTESEKLSQYNINDESVVEALYEVEYLGNGKFSEASVVEYMTYGVFKEKASHIYVSNSQYVYDQFDDSKRKFPLTAEINQKQFIFDEFVSSDSVYRYLIVNGKTTNITVSDGYYSINTIGIVDDLFFVKESGNDINTERVRFYNTDLSMIKELSKVKKNGLKFSIGHHMVKGGDTVTFSLDGNKITVVYTACHHGISLVMENEKWIEAQNDKELAKYGIIDSTPIEFVAEYEYLGNGKFSEMKIIKEYSYKELKDSLGDMNITN